MYPSKHITVSCHIFLYKHAPLDIDQILPYPQQTVCCLSVVCVLSVCYLLCVCLFSVCRLDSTWSPSGVYLESLSSVSVVCLFTVWCISGVSLFFVCCLPFVHLSFVRLEVSIVSLSSVCSKYMFCIWHVCCQSALKFMF